MMILPKFAIGDFWSAFAANHLAALGPAMRALSHETQPSALATYIQILSLLPDLKFDPYFRRFLQHPTQSKEIPNIIAATFTKGVAWLKSSGPGYISMLMIHCLFWVDPKQGDDGRACIDAEIRIALDKKLKAFLALPQLECLDQMQRIEMERLSRVPACAASEEVGSRYILETQRYLELGLEMCGKENCGHKAEMRCSVCKSARYCGKAHQAWHWKNGHKLRCFPLVN